MSQPWNWENSLRNHDTAVLNWLRGLTVNYDNIAGTPRLSEPILSIFAAPDRPFASVPDLLISRGWIAGATDAERRANASEEKWPVLPLPLATIRRGDPTPDPELSGAPKAFRRRFFDNKTRQWITHPWPGHYRTEYTISFWSRSVMTDNYIREWLYSQIGNIGSGDSETFVTVHHDDPWFPMDQSFKLVATSDTSDLEGANPRYRRFDAIFSLRTWIMRLPVATAYAVDRIGTDVSQLDDSVSMGRWGNTGIQSANLFTWILDRAQIAKYWPVEGAATVQAGDPYDLDPVPLLEAHVTAPSDRVEITERDLNLDGQGLCTISVSFQYRSDVTTTIAVSQRDGDTNTLSSAAVRTLPATGGYWKRVQFFTAVNDLIVNVAVAGIGTPAIISLRYIDIRAVNTQSLASPTVRLDGGATWDYVWRGLPSEPFMVVAKVNGPSGGPIICSLADDEIAPIAVKSQSIDSDLNVAWVEVSQPIGSTLRASIPKSAALASVTIQRYGANYNGHDL